MREVKYRVEILRKNIPIGKLDYTVPPSVYMDGEAEIKLSLRGTFRHDDDVNYITDELRPIMTVDESEYPLGVYRVATKSSSGSTAKTITDAIEAYDRSVLLSWAKLENRDFWAAGTSYDVIFSHYLSAAGIARSIIVPSGSVLQSDREDWDVGTSFLEIINTLLAEINYDPIWFDLTGAARIQPYRKPSVDTIDHRYGKSQVLSYLRPEYSSTLDIFSQPNVFIAILENPEYSEPLVARAENDIPASKLSTISRGIRIPQIYNVDNIASAEDLQAYANRLRDESMQLSEIVSVQTANMPEHNVGDIIAIDHDDIAGIYKETAWQMTLAAGQYMSHTLKKVVVI